MENQPTEDAPLSAPETAPTTDHSQPFESSPPDLTSYMPHNIEEAMPSVPAKAVWYKNKKIIVIVAVVVLLIAGGAVTFKMLSKPEAATTPKTVKKAATPKLVKAPAVEEFYENAKQINDLSLLPRLGDQCRQDSITYKNDSSYCPKASNAKYYEISTLADGKLILITTPSEGPNERQEDTYVATVSKNGSATIYTLYPDQISTSIDKTKVTIQKSEYAGLSFPKAVTLNNQLVTRGFEEATYGFYMDGLNDFVRGSKTAKAPNKITTIDGKDFYDVNRQDESTFAIHEIFGAVKDFFAVNYRLKDELITESGNAPITWTDGTTSKDSYTSHGPGCGSAYGYLVLKNADPSEMIKAGVSKSGTTVYQLPTTNTFFGKVYTEDYQASADSLDAKFKSLTKDQFQSNHGLLIAKNGLGQYQVYLNNSLIQGGGCAKPVIYLYPTKTSDVSVQVGANVTVSEPLYVPGKGWQHVTAQPNGDLTYQGKRYSSLFWEGIGIGSYPYISSGTIVPRSAAVSTIRQQLADQGLNKQETSDFLAYWQDKLPNTPFVRLSWLTTNELNTLAPLKITPTPQTTIRTFLDFQGLNLPIKLAPQHFNAPARNGFTVVEWGGLLRD